MTQQQEISGNITNGGTFAGGQATAGSTKSSPVFRAPNNVTITGIVYAPQAAVTGAATNNFALQIQNTGTDGLGTTAVTSTKTYASGTNSVALAPETFTLSATAANLNMTIGQILSLVRTVNGTGLASPDAVVYVLYQNR